VRGVVGHEMGHYKRGHILWFTLAYAILGVIAFGLIQWTYPWAARIMGGPANIADPAGLPVLMAIFATLSLLATPITNTITRTAEADADAFSLRVANEPDGLAKPSDLEEFIFYDHPSVEHRVRKAMDWKAAHMAPFSASPRP